MLEKSKVSGKSGMRLDKYSQNKTQIGNKWDSHASRYKDEITDAQQMKYPKPVVEKEERVGQKGEKQIKKNIFVRWFGFANGLRKKETLNGKFFFKESKVQT